MFYQTKFRSTCSAQYFTCTLAETDVLYGDLGSICMCRIKGLACSCSVKGCESMALLLQLYQTVQGVLKKEKFYFALQ